MFRVQTWHLLFELFCKNAELERRSAHQLRLKAIEILQSSIHDQLTKNHGNDLGLEYLWKGDE